MFRTARLELQSHYIQMKKMQCQVSIFYEKLNVFLGSVVASTLERKTGTQVGTTVPQHLLQLNRTFSRKNYICRIFARQNQTY